MKGQPEATEIMGPERRKSPLYRADLDRCLPASALSREGRLFGWRMIDYETAHFKGVMLRAGPETAAAAVEYPLNLRAGTMSTWDCSTPPGGPIWISASG